MSSLLLQASNWKNCNFLKKFSSDSHDFFYQKCRPFYVVLEKGHGAGKNGMVLDKRGMARRHAKKG